jgi:hypothetical protein
VLGLCELAAALDVNSTLLHLDLASNMVGDANSVAGVLPLNQRLCCLDLSSNPLHESSVKSILRACGRLGGNSGLTELHLGAVVSTAECSYEVGSALATTQGLAALYLNDANLQPLAASAILCGLHSNISLTLLCLNGNEIGNQGATQLAEVLVRPTTIATLELQTNSIGAEGCTQLAESLCTNNSLTRLDLFGNMAAHAGAGQGTVSLYVSVTTVLLLQ